MKTKAFCVGVGVGVGLMFANDFGVALKICGGTGLTLIVSLALTGIRRFYAFANGLSRIVCFR